MVIYDQTSSKVRVHVFEIWMKVFFLLLLTACFWRRQLICWLKGRQWCRHMWEMSRLNTPAHTHSYTHTWRSPGVCFFFFSWRWRVTFKVRCTSAVCHTSLTWLLQLLYHTVLPPCCTVISWNNIIKSFQDSLSLLYSPSSHKYSTKLK